MTIYRMKSAFLTMAATVLVSGCATMSEDECRVADWQIIGYEDGSEGAPQSRIGDHRQACAEYGVVPDLAAYREGYQEGIETFCTESVGYERGRSGSSYNGACPSDLEPAFLDGNVVGREIYEAWAAVAEIESSITGLARDRERLQKRVQKAEAEIVADGTTSARRSELLENIKRDQKALGELEVEKEELLIELGRLELEAEAIEAARPII